MNLYSAKEMTDLLERHGFFFKKNLGQNFLLNESVANRIASSAAQTASSGRKKLAVEIGPGAGALTLQLSKLFDSVLAIEIDPHLIPVLEESLSEAKNVTVINQDALQFDFSSLLNLYPDHSIVCCSNLPYYITSELIMRMLESKVGIESVTVLIQKEAAARLASKPGSADYGSITASVSYYATANRLFSVGPGNFIPRPKVDSAVLQLIPHSEKPVHPKDEKTFFQVIRAAFSARRKTILNALSTSFRDEFPRDDISAILIRSGVDVGCRGETLGLEEFKNISDSITVQRSMK